MKNFYVTLLFLLMGLFVSAQSTEVGITEGQLSVSLSGGANYSIPIAVPPGINGIVPQVSLTYNSQGGNGVAGYGWNIGGISTISRIAATTYHDGIIDPVDFDNLDRFALDGQRLVVKNGTVGSYGANETVYETENFSNIKVTSYGVHSNGANYGPAYFKVEYPDGSKAFYGNSTDSQSITNWAITTWENSIGVRINYQYTISNNDLNIASIKYGALANGTPINEIQFSYIARKRPEQSYVGDQSILKNTILSTIKIFSSGIGYKNYTLGYEETYKDYQRLFSITEKSGDNSKSYNPTIFTYGDLIDNNLTSVAPSTLDLTNIDYKTIGNVSGDFDGDGKTDLILYPKTTTDAKNKYWLYKNISGSALNSGFVHNIGAFEEILPTTMLEGDSATGYKLMTKQGWTVVKYDIGANVATFSAFSSSITAPIGLQYQKTYSFPQLTYYSEHPLSCVQNRPSTKHIENIPKIYLNGDFNGDSLTDIIVIEKNFQYSYLGPCDANNQPLSVNDTYSGITYFVNMDKRLTTNYIFNAGNLSIDSSCKIEIADVNGDGKSDIIIIKKGSVKVYSLNVNNKFIMLFEKNDVSIDIDKIVLLGDYNGDGKADFVIPSKVGEDNWNFFMSTGTNFSKINGKIGIVYNQSDLRKYYQEITNNNDWTTSLNENSFIANDFNGDGKTDILNQQNFTVESDQSGNPNPRVNGTPQMTKFQIALNMSFTESAVKFIPTVTFSYLANKINRYPIPIFANLSDANKTFKYSLITGNSIFGLDMIWYNRFDVLLKKITTGNGVTETISYQPLDTKSKQGQYSVYFSKSHVENYPNIDILNDPNFFVVSMLEKKSSDSYKKKIFQYYSAVSNVDGLGFLGFRGTMQTNWHDDASPIISYLSKNDVSLRGANVENYTVLGLHEPLFESLNQVPGTITKDGSYTVTGTENLVATQSITLNPDTVIESDSDFSASINEEANASVNTPTTFITKMLLTYESNLSPNKVFKLKNISNKQFDGLQNISTETETDYDEYNNPTKNITLIKEGATIVQKNTSDIVYEVPKIAPYIVGRISSKIQNALLGGYNMITEELYEYDANQLLSQIKKKGDAITNYVTENNSYDVFGNITKKIVKAGSDSRETSYEYDSSGRFLSKSIDVEKLATTFQYYANGTLKSKTNPFLQTTLYEYDSWFKKTKETDYLGNKTTYNYSNSLGGVIFTKISDDGTVTEDTFDDLGRKIKSGAKNVMGSFSYVSYLYDIQDRNFKVSEPYIGGSPSQWNETKYDEYGRIFQTIAHTFKTVDITYSGLTTQIYDGTKNETYVKDALGNVISKWDKPDNIIRYTYFPNGSLKETNYGGVKTIVSLDGWGRKSQLEDPSAGIFKYKYNDFGELTSEENKNGITTYKLNSVGKVVEKTIVGGANTKSKTTYIYNDTSKLLVSSKFEDFTNGTNTITTEYTYDPSKRISKSVETTPYAVFTKDFTYDSFERLLTETSTAARSGKSSVKKVKYTYQNGSQYQIFDNDTNALLWQTNTVNARGQLLTAVNGPTTITNNYDPYGYTLQLKYDKTASSVNILTLNTAFFDVKKGNLDSRSNSLFAWNESFKYDVFDRLTEYTNSKGVQETQSYDDKGRITQNSLGTYNYAGDKPYQNSSISVTPEALTYYTAKPTQNISYNTFKSPVLIDEKGIDKISFEYNDANGRSAMFYGDLLDDKLKKPYHKYYSADGSMEIKENIKTGVFDFVTYIGGDGYSAPIVVKSDGLSNQKYLYLQRDFQGSIVSITDQSGAVVEKRLFDAWGSIVKVQDGAGNILSGLTILDRGYTGHEHLQSVGIINMNGRLYDPKLHRFLQPDNNIQDPFNTQNYNRYGYVLNNPLKYTDPTGEFWNFVAMALSAYIHAGAATGEANPLKWNANNLMGAFSGIGSGLASSYATGATNSYIDNYNNKPPQGASAISSGNNDQFIHNYVSVKESNPSRYNHEAFAYAGLLTTGLVADDVTVVGVADDVLIPVAWGVATTVWVWDNREVIRDDAREIVDAIHRSLDPKGFHYVTYTKTSLDGSKVYVGRSSGYGTPEDIVKRRDANHHITGYNDAVLSSSLPATKPGGYTSRLLDSSYWAIRGSEQLQIDYWRNKKMSGNIREGIGSGNENITKYINWGIKLLY